MIIKYSLIKNIFPFKGANHLPCSNSIIQQMNLSDSLKKQKFSMYNIVKSRRRRQTRRKLSLPFSKNLVAWFKVVVVRIIKQTKFCFKMKIKERKKKLERPLKQFVASHPCKSYEPYFHF
jgi:hypothetical protein